MMWVQGCPFYDSTGGFPFLSYRFDVKYSHATLLSLYLDAILLLVVENHCGNGKITRD